MFKYLYYEIDNTEVVQEQQKLVVAEFGLLDVQVAALGKALRNNLQRRVRDTAPRQRTRTPPPTTTGPAGSPRETLYEGAVESAVEGFLQGAEPTRVDARTGVGKEEEEQEAEEMLADDDELMTMEDLDVLLASTGLGMGELSVRGLVDADELSVVAKDVLDLGTRLGLDALIEDNKRGPLSLSVPKFSADELARKFGEAASFYVQGSRLLGQDVQYALRLILKAILGDTLQPREVPAFFASRLLRPPCAAVCSPSLLLPWVCTDART